MTALKKLLNKLKKLSIPLKIQLVIALICTLAIPVYAWFSFHDKIEAMTKIKEPPSINLASGGDDPAVYISLENIDVTAGPEKYIVFSIEPGKYSAYDIQLSHTTNIPFTYELYRVKEDPNGTIEYTDHSRNMDVETGENVETTLHYSIMTTYNYSVSGAAAITAGKVSLQDINPDDNSTGRILGDEGRLSSTRKNYLSTDDVNQYVKPLYSIARKIPQLIEADDGSAERDYYAIKLSWIPGDGNMTYESAEYWNRAFNNKETDLIYISAKQNASETP